MSKRIALFIGDGTEPIEAIAPADALRRGNVEVVLVSVMGRKDVTLNQDVRIVADALIEEVDIDAFDMLIVPGGTGGVENLKRSASLSAGLKDFMAKGRPVGSICAGPTILAELGLLEGRRATCYPGCQTDFPANVYQDVLGVVVDGNLITASGPGQALDFGIALLRLLEGDAVADTTKSSMLITQ